MMDNVRFETDSGMVYPENHGMILKSFSAPAPLPKIYRESIDGADGELDMTEWAGEVRYNMREVKAVFRDMSFQKSRELLNAINGRRVKIYHSAYPGFCFDGRCERVEEKAARHVDDITLTFVCQPYRMAQIPTVISETISGDKTLTLQALQKTVIPKFTATGTIDLTYGDKVYFMDGGKYTFPNVVVTKTPHPFYFSGTGTLKIEWRDGVM